MSIKKVYLKTQCPNCQKNCISYWQKIKLIDFRYSYICKECGGTIKLPLWHTLLYLIELSLLIFLIVKLQLSTGEAIISGIFMLLFIWFIQLPFIPIKG